MAWPGETGCASRGSGATDTLGSLFRSLPRSLPIAGREGACGCARAGSHRRRWADGLVRSGRASHRAPPASGPVSRAMHGARLRACLAPLLTDRFRPLRPVAARRRKPLPGLSTAIPCAGDPPRSEVKGSFSIDHPWSWEIHHPSAPRATAGERSRRREAFVGGSPHQSRQQRTPRPEYRLSIELQPLM
jgi:hypothetical protein